MLTSQDMIQARYRIVRPLGQGGMGSVFLAQDTLQQREVALKIMTLGPQDSPLRFRREFRLMARLQHPHIVRVYDSGSHEGLPFLVMEYLRGGTLRDQWLEAVSDSSQCQRRLALLCEVAQALAYIHGQGIVHRDVKPDNVMLEQEQSRLMDFGLAKAFDDTLSAQLTQRGSVMGTAAYMSPEQIRGEAVDARSDLYAFGCLLYWALVGEPPFVGKVFSDTLIKQLRDSPVPPSQRNPAVSAALDSLLLRLLEKAPEDRYSNASDVAEALHQQLHRASHSRTLRLEPNLLRLPEDLDTPTSSELLNTPLLGREASLAWLQHAQQQGLSPVLIESSMGLGLSRLLHSWQQQMRTSGRRVLTLRFYAGLPLPYQAWRQLFRQQERRYPQAFRQAYVGLEPALAPLLGRWQEDEQSLDANMASLRLYDAIDQCLARFAAHMPLLLIADDLHYADDDSLNILQYLAQRQTPPNLPMVLGFKPALANVHSRQRLHKLAAERHSLAPLSPEAMRQLLAAWLGAEVEARLESYILDRAAGNPLFAKEMLAAMLEAKQLRRRAGLWEWSRAPVSVPSSLEGMLQERLSSLEEQAQKTLRIASSIGRRFAFPLLQHLLQCDEDSLLDDLDALLRAGLIREEAADHYSFVYPLLRDVLHDSLQQRRRRRYHQQLAEYLQQNPSTPAEVLAEHYAETDEALRAFPYALRAARHAMAVFANDNAETYYRLGLRLLEQNPSSPHAAEQPQVQLELGMLCERIGRWQEAAQLYEQVSGDTALYPKSLQALGKLAHKQGDLKRAQQLLEQARRAAPQDPSICSALGDVLRLQGEVDAAEAVLIEALALLLETAEPWEVVADADKLEPSSMRNCASPGNTSRRDAASSSDSSDSNGSNGSSDADADAITHTVTLNDTERAAAIAQAQADLGLLETNRGNFSQAMAWFASALQHLPEDGLLIVRAKIKHWIGVAEYRRGRLSAAQQQWQDAYATYQQAGDLERVVTVLQNLAVVLHELGNHREALATYEAVRRRAERLGNEKVKADASMNLGDLLSEEGRFDEALQLLRAAQHYYRDAGLAPGEVQSSLSIVEVMTQCRRFDEALDELQAVQTQLASLSQAPMQANAQLKYAHIRLMQGQLDDALQSLQQAESVFREQQALFSLLDCCLLLALLYLAQGETMQFQHYLQEAQRLGEEMQDEAAGWQVAYLAALSQRDSTATQDLQEKLGHSQQRYFLEQVAQVIPTATL